MRARGDSADAASAEAAGLQHRLQAAELAWLREKQQLNDELGRSKVTCSVTRNLIYLTPPELAVHNEKFYLFLGKPRLMVCCSIRQRTQSVVTAVQEALQAAQQQVERLQDERSSSGAQAAAKVDAAMERARQQVHTRAYPANGFSPDLHQNCYRYTRQENRLQIALHRVNV